MISSDKRLVFLDLILIVRNLFSIKEYYSIKRKRNILISIALTLLFLKINLDNIS